jgi:lipopolysaccharide-binding protein
VSRPKIGDDGTVDLKTKDMSLSQTVSVRNDGSGRLVVLAGDCSFDVREISVEFHGGASWLYNLFTSFIEGKIKDHLKSQVNYKQLPKII